jgi:hypothetical protein
VTWGLFLQEENNSKMRVIRVGTRKSQVSAGVGCMEFVRRVVLRWSRVEGLRRFSAQQKGNGVVGGYTSG